MLALSATPKGNETLPHSDAWHGGCRTHLYDDYRPVWRGRLNLNSNPCPPRKDLLTGAVRERLSGAVCLLWILSGGWVTTPGATFGEIADMVENNAKKVLVTENLVCSRKGSARHVSGEIQNYDAKSLRP